MSRVTQELAAAAPASKRPSTTPDTGPDGTSSRRKLPWRSTGSGPASRLPLESDLDEAPSERDALVWAVLGRPSGFPSPDSVDLEPFWRSFDARAPVHLRVGFGAAVAGLCVVLPRRLGYRHSLRRLSSQQREHVMQHAATRAMWLPVLEVAKVVACFAWFDDAEVDEAARSRPSGRPEPPPAVTARGTR